MTSFSLPSRPPSEQPIVREIKIVAKPETIFAFFVDPDKLIRWKGIKAELDPQPGGMYRLNLNGSDIASGNFIAVEPYNRIAFTWGWEGANSTLPPGASTVEITLTYDGQQTTVRLIHSGLNTEQTVHQSQGWDFFLPRLLVAASGGSPELYVPPEK